MTSYVRIALVATLALGLTSVAYGGWGHRHGYYHGGYVPYGYAPAGYVQPGYFQSGGSVAQLVFGDRPIQIDFGAGDLIPGLEVEVDLGSPSGDSIGDVVEVRSLSVPVRSYYSYRSSSRSRSDDYNYYDDSRNDVGDLRRDVRALGDSIEDLRRRVRALEDRAGMPASESGESGSLGEVTRP